MGSEKLPAAVPDRQSALARERLLSKYRAVRMIPVTKLITVFHEGKKTKKTHIFDKKGGGFEDLHIRYPICKSNA